VKLPGFLGVVFIGWWWAGAEAGWRQRWERLVGAVGLAAGAVVAQGLVKRAVGDGAALPLDTALAVEQQAFVDAFRTEDASIGVASFVASGPGKAEFVGR